MLLRKKVEPLSSAPSSQWNALVEWESRSSLGLVCVEIFTRHLKHSRLRKLLSNYIRSISGWNHGSEVRVFGDCWQNSGYVWKGRVYKANRGKNRASYRSLVSLSLLKKAGSGLELFTCTASNERLHWRFEGIEGSVFAFLLWFKPDRCLDFNPRRGQLTFNI